MVWLKITKKKILTQVVLNAYINKELNATDFLF